ncbi:hypothetical protein Vafri_5362, partial [Volvox africanus]
MPPLTERVRQLRAGFGGRVPTQQAHNREMRSRVSYMSDVLNWDFHLPAAHTAGQDSSCGGSTPSTTSANRGEQSPPTFRSGAGRSNAIQAAPTAPLPPPSAPSPPSSSPSAQGIASSSQQPPSPAATTPESQPNPATNSPSAASAAPAVPAAPSRSLVTLMPPSSPPRILVEQHVPHAPELAGSLVKSAFSDAPTNASAAASAVTEGESAAATGMPGADGSTPDGASATAAAAGLTADHLFRRASLRGSVSLPDLKQKQDNQARPSGLTPQSRPQQPEQLSAQTQEPLAITEGTLRGRSGATGGGGGGR